jgi:hypothetical protein
VPAQQSEAVTSRTGAWHQSTLSLIHDCSWRYFLTYKMGLEDPSGPQARAGTAVHSGIELHERARLEGKELPSLKEMTEAAFEGVEDDLHDMVRHGLRHWYKTPMKDGAVLSSHRDWVMGMEPILIEPYFNAPLVDGALPIGGWIDAVYKDADGMYQIVDWKTAGSMSRWKKDGDGKRHQATMYSIGLQITDLIPDLDYLAPMTYAIVKPGTGGECARRVGPIVPDFEDVRVLGQKIRDAEAIVASESYARNPAWVLCSETWCPHFTGCQITGELSGTPVTLRNKLSQVRGYNTDYEIKAQDQEEYQ